MRKELHAATDFSDDISQNGLLYEERHIDALMAYLAGLGATRVEWVIKQAALMERGYPGGFDLLAVAVDRAHAHGMEFYPIFKPFEGCHGFGLPHSFPRPEGVPLLEDMRGLMPSVDPFVAAHPHLRFKRRPGDEDPGGALATLKLIKGDTDETRIKKEHLSIWSSPQNNRLIPYEQDFNLRETLQWRPGFPLYYQGRVLTLEGLRIPENHRYIVVKCSLADGEGDFTNLHYQMVELFNDRGQAVPATPATPPGEDVTGPRPGLRRFPLWRMNNAYFRTPEVQALLDDPDSLREHFRDCYNYDFNFYREGVHPDRLYTLDGRGSIAVARGKNPYLPGPLHPIYPEVCQYWMGWVRFCIERGVDGIDFRVGNHSDRSHDKEQYGFNEPVLEKAGGMDRDAVARVNGDAYTQFLAQARDELKRHGKSICVHINSNMLAQDARGLGQGPLPPNTEWQWERWIREIADSVLLRGLFRLREPEHHFVLDRVSRVAREAGKKFIYQSTIKETREAMLADPAPRIAWEMDYVRGHKRVDAYQLYETANFTRINDRGDLEGSEGMAELVSRHLPA
jgi:hypothetical protein